MASSEPDNTTPSAVDASAGDNAGVLVNTPPADTVTSNGAARTIQTVDGFEISFDTTHTFPCVVRDKDWKYTITGIKTVVLGGENNNTDQPVSYRYSKTVGMEKNSSVTLGGALSAGVSCVGAQLGLSGTWSSTMSESTQTESTVTVPPRSEVRITDEVMVGYRTRRGRFAVKTQEPFAVHSPIPTIH
jgi:hypothetical protein